MANPPPPYDGITGISRADMKDNFQETIGNYDGNARPGELVVDQLTSTVYVGNALGELTAVAAPGGITTWATLDDKNNNNGPIGITLGKFAGQGGQGLAAIAIGEDTGGYGQGASAVSVGQYSGSVGQGAYSVAVGPFSGQANQGYGAVGIGYGAGQTTQGTNAIAIGESAARNWQGTSAIAIGTNAGQGYGATANYTSAGSSGTTLRVAVTQGTIKPGSLVYGTGFSTQTVITVVSSTEVTLSAAPDSTPSGQLTFLPAQGANSIALGAYAGEGNTNAQSPNTIILNATGTGVDGVASQPNRFYVKPVRNGGSSGLPAGFYQMAYNPTTGEIVYYT